MTKEDDASMERRMTAVETTLKLHVESCDKRSKRIESYSLIIIGVLLAYAVKVVFHIPVG